MVWYPATVYATDNEMGTSTEPRWNLDLSADSYACSMKSEENWRRESLGMRWAETTGETNHSSYVDYTTLASMSEVYFSFHCLARLTPEVKFISANSLSYGTHNLANV